MTKRLGFLVSDSCNFGFQLLQLRLHFSIKKTEKLHQSAFCYKILLTEIFHTINSTLSSLKEMNNSEQVTKKIAVLNLMFQNLMCPIRNRVNLHFYFIQNTLKGCQDSRGELDSTTPFPSGPVSSNHRQNCTFL